jgi:hypothetical protein
VTHFSERTDNTSLDVRCKKSVQIFRQNDIDG